MIVLILILDHIKEQMKITTEKYIKENNVRIFPFKRDY